MTTAEYKYMFGPYTPRHKKSNQVEEHSVSRAIANVGAIGALDREASVI